METLVVVAHHRSQYYATRSKTRVSNRFGSSPSRGFKGINCRTFESNTGILPSPQSVVPSFNNYHEPKPPRAYSELQKPSKRSNPISISSKHTKGPNFNDDIEEFATSFHSYHEPKSPCAYSELPEPSKRSNPISISPKPTIKGPSFNDDIEEFAYSELWAGPAYSNSPPPSSLPIPKFSLCQKRSVSLELPLPSSGIELPLIAKSAPPSPSRESFSSATENLRRILHLDIADD